MIISSTAVMVRCKSCHNTTNNPTGKSWDLWQLCFKCALIIHPIYYKKRGLHDHGIGTVEKQMEVQSIYEAQIKTLE